MSYRMTPEQVRSGLNGSNKCRSWKMRCGPVNMARLGEDKECIAELILSHGVSIDECAEKWSVHPMTICRLMGWV